MNKLDCREISREVQGRIKALISELAVFPCLRIILVGNNPCSLVYVSHKVKLAEKLGMDCQVIHMDESSPEEDVKNTILSLNENPGVHGILLQMPLPPGINGNRLALDIDPSKDVDGFHPLQKASKLRGSKYFVPCTPLGCLYILKKTVGKLDGMNALVIGRSFIVGKPMSELLLDENCTVTVAHSHTKNIAEICSQADILVAAVGKPKFIKGTWIKEGAVVLDVGINRLEDSTLVGDVDFDSTSSVGGKITPVPGGIGPMTVTMLAWNTLGACLAQSKSSTQISTMP